MAEELKSNFSRYLKNLANSLDISESAAEKAEGRYKSVSTWLARKESSVSGLSSDIYPQGSFRLGTVVKPISDAEEYDVDLVCELRFDKNQISQKRLKHLVGNEIKAYVSANNISSPVEESKRCWTLNYADSAQFHLDILPAIPDGDSFGILLKSKGYLADFTHDAIAITDNTLSNYTMIDRDWPRSNPKGYAEWFKERIKVRYIAEKAHLADVLKANIENIPDYKIKTPLQQAVQLLKRHRDIMFAKDQEIKPISIIITTLAAHAYNNEPDLLDALISIANGMPGYITKQSGILRVANPVNPLENFAEKWNLHSEKFEAFNRWILQVQTDLKTALQASSVQEFSESLKPKIGERIANEALKSFPNPTLTKVGTAVLQKPITVSQLDILHRQKPLWPVQNIYPVEVSARIKVNGHWQPFASKSSPLPKHYSLQFSAKTDIPQPYQVFWQVVNTGEEAKNAGGLRGKIFPADSAEVGGLIQNESTLYTGMHWIECFIVKNGICLGRSGEYIVNIE